MAVESMKYINLMGPLNMFDEFVLKYIINHNIQLEPSYTSLDISGLIPFDEDTSIYNLKKRMTVLNDKFKANIKEYERETIDSQLSRFYDKNEIEEFVEKIEQVFAQYHNKIEGIKGEIKEREHILNQIIHIKELDINMEEVFNFSYMKFRFGVVPKVHYQKQKKYIKELDVVVVPVSDDDENIWLSYFMPASAAPVIDNVFSTMGFERIWIPDRIKGKPKESVEKLNKEIENLQNSLFDIESEFTKYINENNTDFEEYYNRVLYMSKVNDVKKLACHSRETFFLVGWIPLKDYQKLESDIESVDKIVISGEDPDSVVHSTPPTIMKNNRFLKPFETLVTMYGLPSAKELDPTPFTAITYTLMFGFMFGDVGQGAIIALLGLFLYKWRKMNIGGIMMYVGISSTLFGFVYGSVFGNEEIIKPLWSSPLHGSNTINALLYGAVGFGAVIIVITMVANIINNIRLKKWGKLLFDKNGLAGLMFYGGIGVVIVNSLRKGEFAVTIISIFAAVIIPSLLILFKGPLENLILHKKEIFPKEKGMYFVEAFFELFETVLSFFSGTVSFARVGAFALNHAGLSLAVWTLYNMMHGFGGIIIVIIGNILTIGLEGLIVAIQCMRLEYYEMFGRFYIGEGREFKAVKVTED